MEWPLCMITSVEQISPPSRVCKQNSSHLHSLGVNILFNFSALGIYLCKTWQLFNFNTRLGGEICSSDVNMLKGHWPFVRVRFRFDFIFILPSLLRWTVYVKKNRSFTMGLLPLNAAPRDNLFELCSSNFDEEGNKGPEHI